MAASSGRFGEWRRLEVSDPDHFILVRETWTAGAKFPWPRWSLTIYRSGVHKEGFTATISVQRKPDSHWESNMMDCAPPAFLARRLADLVLDLVPGPSG